jgi:hypothetical protein
MTFEQIQAAAKRVGLDLVKIAGDLTHADLKRLSVVESATLLNLLRGAIDAALAFKNALPKKTTEPRFLAR